MNVEIIPLAQRDLRKAAEYYYNERPGLDQAFLGEVDSAVAAIAANRRRSNTCGLAFIVIC